MGNKEIGRNQLKNVAKFHWKVKTWLRPYNRKSALGCYLEVYEID